MWGSANIRVSERISALVHINLIPLRVHWGHVIGLAPLRGNPTPSQDWEDYFLPDLHRKEKLTSLGRGLSKRLQQPALFGASFSHLGQVLDCSFHLYSTIH